MIENDIQTGKPHKVYTASYATITGTSAVEGMIAEDNTNKTFGIFNGTSWNWLKFSGNNCTLTIPVAGTAVLLDYDNVGNIYGQGRVVAKPAGMSSTGIGLLNGDDTEGGAIYTLYLKPFYQQTADHYVYFPDADITFLSGGSLSLGGFSLAAGQDGTIAILNSLNDGTLLITGVVRSHYGVNGKSGIQIDNNGATAPEGFQYLLSVVPANLTSNRTHTLPNYNVTWPTTDAHGYMHSDGSGILTWSTTVVEGTGTANYVTKWSGTNVVENSIIRDDGTGVSIGLYAAPTARVQLNIVYAVTDPAGPLTGLACATYSVATAGNVAHQNYGINSTLFVQGVNNHTQPQIGILGAGYNNGSGLVSTLEGFRCTIGNLSTGNTTSMYGSKIIAYSPGAGTVTNLYGLYIENMSIGTTINSAITTNSGNVIFNEGGDVASDFRWESDTEEYMLYGDANGDTNGALYFGGTTDGVKVIKGGNMSFLGTAGFYPRRIRQNDIPASGTSSSQIDVGEMLFWVDANDSDHTYLVFHDPTHGIIRVNLEA